jgi:hypothetical protein
VIAAVVVMIAGRPFLLDIRDLTIGCELPVVTGHATARKIREAEETNKAHHPRILLKVPAALPAGPSVLGANMSNYRTQADMMKLERCS